MPKRRRDPEDSADLDLAPFMNMVVVLIPMLLLSVIFIRAGVVNVSTNLTTPSATPDEETKPLKLTVALSHQGFDVLAEERRLAPVEGCPGDGPTICLADASFDVAASFERAKHLHNGGRADEADGVLQRAMQAYDFRGLYNQLSAIKADHPDETKVILTGEPDMPYAMLIRAMDVARFQLDKQSYGERSTFWAANEKVEAGKARALFSDPVLAVAQ